MIDPNVINSVFQGLVVLLGAVASFTAVRGRQAGVRRRDFKLLEQRFLASVAHIFRLETELAERGIAYPARPGILDDPDELPPPPAPRASA